MIKRSNDEYFEIRRKSRGRLRFEVCMHVFGLVVGGEIVRLYCEKFSITDEVDKKC